MITKNNWFIAVCALASVTNIEVTTLLGQIRPHEDTQYSLIDELIATGEIPADNRISDENLLVFIDETTTIQAENREGQNPVQKEAVSTQPLSINQPSDPVRLIKNNEAPPQNKPVTTEKKELKFRGSRSYLDVFQQPRNSIAQQKNASIIIKYQCTYCKTPFSQKSQLSGHIRNSHPEEINSCPYDNCSIPIKNSQDWYHHIVLLHTNQGCPIQGCGMFTMYTPPEESFFLHIMVSHAANGRCKCPYQKCTMAYTHQPALTAHIAAKHTKS